MLFIAIDDEIFEVMVSWCPEWHALNSEKVEKIAAE